jgi:PleD family two-component response regulator
MAKKVLAAVDDLFFAAKIKATGETAGAEVRFAKSLSKAISQAEEDAPDCVLVDLHSEKCEPMALARAFKASDQLKEARLIGFFSHVQTALMREAQAAGYDDVLPRSAFTKRLPELLGSGE